MAPQVAVLTSEEADNKDSHFARLCNFLGVKAAISNLFSGDGNLKPLEEVITKQDTCIVLRGDTLAKLFKDRDGGERLKRLFLKASPFMLLYDLSPKDSHIFALQRLTGGDIASLCRFDHCNYAYEISSSEREIARELSGIRFGPINNLTDFGLNLRAPSKNLSSLISINTYPSFVRLRKGGCDLFIIGSKGIVDLYEGISDGDNLQKHFLRLVPHLMFLKYVFQETCWHARQTLAALIIDDPLLQEYYGFLRYRDLLQVMDAHNFASTIAFIPWNFKRTARPVAELFRRRRDRLSLCVHGCDHTDAEFGGTDKRHLNRKVKLATLRMLTHKENTGVDFDKVMVFPQGIFSGTSMRVLKSNNYSAAVNSTPYPCRQSGGHLRISDFLEMAITTHEGFPLFVRRYPEHLVDFAFDAFLGKPILIVQHHRYFEDGYKNVIKLAKAINSISGAIKWKGLGDIIRASYWERRGSNGNIYCKIYTNNALIKNELDRVARYIVVKSETNNVPIKEVLVDGKNWPYSIANGTLSLSVEIEAQGVAKIELIYEDIGPPEDEMTSLAEALKVSARRYLSEFRDNYVCRHPSLLRLCDKLVRLVSTR